METVASKAVFLSYASQDAEVAGRICQALRAAGVEVWFDQSELRGGDAWDQKIRKQIHECALFVAVISQHTQGRLEGYFRREWKLAVDRSHDMAAERTFLLPVVVDNTAQRTAMVPEAFLKVQWTWAPGGAPPAAFVARVAKLVAGAVTQESLAPFVAMKTARRLVAGRQWVRRRWLVAASVIALGLAVGGYLGRREPAPAADGSIAVLAFANLSDDKATEYFSDGISEELLNVLAKFPDLRVAARTSAFYFKGRNIPIPEIARKLNVAYVLEGSVRKSGDKVRITAQLIKSADGFHVWSQAFDREFKDVFAVQDEIAQTIVGELRGRLTGGVAPAALRAQVRAAAKGGTENPEAFQQFLQGKFFLNRGSPEDYAQAVRHFRAATEFDAKFAQAWAELGRTHGNMAQFALAPFAGGFQQARAAAEQALKLEPDLADGHLALAQVRMVHDWDVRSAGESIRRALELAPGDAPVVGAAAMMALFLGQTEKAREFGRRAAELDPVNPQVRVFLAVVLFYTGHLPEAEAEVRRALELNPSITLGPSMLSYVCMQQGRYDEALAAVEREKEEHLRLVPVALVRLAQGQRAEADAALTVLIEKYSDKMAFNVAQIYAMRGETDQAFGWLARAGQQRDSGLAHAKLDPFLRSLHADPRWAGFLKQLGLADEPAR